MRRTIVTAAFAAVVTAAVTMGTVAIAQSGSDVFYACAQTNGEVKHSTIRVNDIPTCSGGTSVVSWNAEGPTGPPGADGADGADGAPGPGTTRLRHVVTAGNGVDPIVFVESPACPAGSKAVSGSATPFPVFNQSLFQSTTEAVTSLDGLERWFVGFGSTAGPIPSQQFRVTVECEALP